ncbi:MAG TPA: hypothetical protein PKY25_02760 [Bacilli bacterium]|nr:hypothetical protein [Bacilli bacterium]
MREENKNLLKSIFIYISIALIILIAIAIVLIFNYSINNKKTTTTTGKTTKITTTQIPSEEISVFGCFGGNTIENIPIGGRTVSIYFYGIQLEYDRCLSVVYADTTLLAKTYRKYEFYKVANYKDAGIVLLGNKTGYGPSSYSRTAWYLKIFDLDGGIVFQDNYIYAQDITTDVVIGDKITYTKHSYNKTSTYTVEYMKDAEEPYFKKTKIE